MKTPVPLLVFISVIVVISGCTQTQDLLAEAPSVEIEATVTSLFFDELSEDDCGVCPSDRATIVIDYINHSKDPDNTIPLNIDDEISIHFEYSARPAKLRHDCAIIGDGTTPNDPETPVSSPNYEEKPTEIENGYLVYHLPEDHGETDIILPGLEDGSVIKITVWGGNLHTSDNYIDIGIYEIVAQCFSDSDCGENLFCEFINCNTEYGGLCTPKPDISDCEVGGSICSCDGDTYPSDCHRKAAGASRNYIGECIEQISQYRCWGQFDCSAGLQCIDFPAIGRRCAEPDPCSYFDCSKQSENSICILQETFYLGPGVPYGPFNLICTGNCDSDGDCEENEFCDSHPCDLGAGYCAEIPSSCGVDYSPICGCDGNTYDNDCFRKMEKVSKNYKGECIDEISNVSCDVDDQFKDTCDFIGTCVQFPGIGRRCADENVFEYYPCPENLELYDLFYIYPRVYKCNGHANCSSHSDCGSTIYADWFCNIPSCNSTTGRCVEIDECPEDYEPVCGCDDNDYQNDCFRIMAGVGLSHSGECIQPL